MPITNYVLFAEQGYECWKAMKRRCSSPKYKSYKHYGGKGITVTEKWLTFEGFISDMGPRPTVKHTIDRIDNSKGYFKENCRWATRGDQTRNRRIAYECVRGHPWTPENTIPRNYGKIKSRRCRICYLAGIERRAKQKATLTPPTNSEQGAGDDE